VNGSRLRPRGRGRSTVTAGPKRGIGSGAQWNDPVGQIILIPIVVIITTVFRDSPTTTVKSRLQIRAGQRVQRAKRFVSAHGRVNSERAGEGNPMAHRPDIQPGRLSCASHSTARYFRPCALLFGETPMQKRLIQTAR